MENPGKDRNSGGQNVDGVLHQRTGMFESVERVTRFLAALIAVGAAIWATYQFLGSHFQYFPRPTLDEVVPASLVVHAVTVFLLLGSPILLPRMKVTDKYRDAIAASRQFIWFWSGIWVSWLALYVIWALFWSSVVKGSATEAVHITLDACNLASAAFFFLCYLVMVLHSVPPKQYGWYRVVFWVFTSCGVLLISEVVTASYDPTAAVFFDWLEGLLSGVALALFVGRLDSHFLHSPRWAVSALYAYAIIQLSYPSLEKSDPSKALAFILITSVALLLKVLLYWQVRLLISSGKLTYYMFEYRRLIDSDPGGEVGELLES